MIIVLSLAAVVAAAVWVVVAVPRSRSTSERSRGVRLLTIDRPFPAGGRFASDPYTGSQVCAECHAGEAALHSRSGHARTLSPVGRLPLARRLDGTRLADPEMPQVHWSYRFRDGQLHIARQAPGKDEECIAEYAFGSGRHATTFVNVIDPKIPAILEHRLTYYAQQGALAITPGHTAHPRPPGLTYHGVVLSPLDSRRCFDCHTTEISAGKDRRIDESTMIPNVSCERCHGPGRAHVAAARRGAPESQLSLPFGPDGWTVESLLLLCGACHRHPSQPDFAVIRPEQIRLARFQPIGIMKSKCYTASGGAFSCVTCHDPHARASSDRAAYDVVCASCHAAGGSTAAAARSTPQPADPVAAAGSRCPVSPRGRCVECHMPRVDSGQSFLVSDHWIRVRGEGEFRSTDRTPRPGSDATDLNGR
jgi:hypothetical protein